MKKIFIIMLLAVTLMACTNNETVVKPVETADVYGTWTYKQGNIETFLTDARSVANNIVIFGVGGYFREKTVYICRDTTDYFDKDTVVYGKWKLQNDSLFVMSLTGNDTVVRKVTRKNMYLKIGNACYLNDTLNTYPTDIIGSWYQLGSTDQSFYQFNGNGTMNHYYRPVTPTVQDDYTWAINENMLITRMVNDTVESYEDIEYINEYVGKWGGHFYQKSR